MDNRQGYDDKEMIWQLERYIECCNKSLYPVKRTIWVEVRFSVFITYKCSHTAVQFVNKIKINNSKLKPLVQVKS